jgi:predicted hydrolase (HD superfamily)
MGNLMARVLPHGLLNPGKFNIKEHVLVTIISTAAGGIPHGIDNIVMQHGRKYFADATVNIWNGMAWVAVTQLIGFGVSGFLIRILIKPAAMFW